MARKSIAIEKKTLLTRHIFKKSAFALLAYTISVYFSPMQVLLLPTTYVKKIILKGLRPFDLGLTVLVPTESSPVVEEVQIPYKEEVQTLVPVPLGPRIETFKGIIKSYLAWASHIDLGRSIHAEELERLQVDDPESVQALINKIRDDNVEDDILKAQIFLELSMIFDIQYDSIEQEFSNIRKGEALLQRLMDGPDVEGRDSWEELMSMRLPAMTQPQRRLESWGRLFRELKGDALPFDILLGEGREIRDALDAEYEEISGKNAPTPLLKLHLHPFLDLESLKEKGVGDEFHKVLRTIGEARDIGQKKEEAQRFEALWQRLQPKETPLVLSLVFYEGVDVIKDLILKETSPNIHFQQYHMQGHILFIE